MAAQKDPELFYAFIGVGQVADFNGRAALERAFITEQAHARGESDALYGLDRANAAQRRALVNRFGGDVHAFGGSCPFVRTAFEAPEYCWSDYISYFRGLRLYSHRTELYTIDPTTRVHAVSVPVFSSSGALTRWHPHSLPCGISIRSPLR